MTVPVLGVRGDVPPSVPGQHLAELFSRPGERRASPAAPVLIVTRVQLEQHRFEPHAGRSRECGSALSMDSVWVSP